MDDIKFNGYTLHEGEDYLGIYDDESDFFAEFPSYNEAERFFLAMQRLCDEYTKRRRTGNDSDNL